MTARDILGGLLAEPGPWTTVLADISRDVPDPKRTVDLRHRALLESLEQQGAPQADRDAVEAALAADHDTPSPSARFLAVRDGRGAARPPLDEAFWAALAAGLPSFAGVALGVDRLLMAMLGTERITDVLAFDFGRA